LQKNTGKVKKTMTEKKKMIAGAYYHSIDATLIKTADTLNLLHRLNVTEYRITKKAKEIIAGLQTQALTFILSHRFIVIMATILFAVIMCILM
jgi:hypothetical protein